MPMNRMEKDARNRAAMTYLTGRAPPPRFRPIVIILMVLIVGAMIIGLITTILAYFPGYSAKGVDALRIAGPVVLAGSALALGGMIAEICVRHQREQKLVEKSFHDLTSSRMTLASRQSAMSVASSNQQPAANARPSKSILKNASSSSTYSDSGVPGHSGSYEQDSSSTGSATGANYKVDMNPDPTAHRNHAPRSQAPRSTRQHNGEVAAPYSAPVQRGYGNRAYSQESETRETDIDGDLEVNGHSTPNAKRREAAPSAQPREQPKRVMQTYANQGFDVYDPASNITGAGLLQTSGLMDTSSTSPARPADQTPRRWGSSNPSTPRATQPPAGYGNQGYAASTPPKNTRQQVSTVTETYQHITTSQTPRQTTTRKYQQSVATPQRHTTAPQAAQTPSSSTEV